MNFTVRYSRSARTRKNVVAFTFSALLFATTTTTGYGQSGGRAQPINPLQPETSLDLNRALSGRGPKPAPGIPGIRQAPGAADTKPFMKLADVSVTGALSIPDGLIAQCYRQYIGRMVSQADLVDIAEKISQLYRDAGFHLSRAIVPPQDIKDGRVLIKVIEGRVADIRLEGYRAAQFGVERILHPLLLESPSRLTTFERHLLLANGVPGVRVVDSALEEIGEMTGNFRLTVTVETSRGSVTAAADNLGSATVGRGEAFLTSTLNSTLVPGDGLAMTASTIPEHPDELAFGRAIYDAPVGSNGVRFGATAWYSSIWPGDYRRQLNTQTDSSAVEIRGSIAPLQTQKSSLRLTVAAGAGYFTEKNELGRIYADEVRTATLAADGNFTDSWGGHDYLGVAFRQGLGILGATPENDPLVSHIAASGVFSIWGFSLSRYQALSDTWSIRAAGAGQFAGEPLMFSQQFYLGGAAFGRGFDAGEISGDNGIAGTAELRYDHGLDTNLAKAYQLYAFADSGMVWDYHDDIGILYLTSVGLGARLFVTDNFQAGAAIAFPVSYRTLLSDHQAPRFLFTLSDTFAECQSPKWCL
jgi:hemolysin activation/secretion protein